MKKLLPLLFLVSCGPTLKSESVYRTELALYDSWSVQLAKFLRGFIKDTCKCSLEGKFLDNQCQDAADILLVVEARHTWHRDMMLYNSGFLETRPSETPPEFAPLICPLPELK